MLGRICASLLTVLSTFLLNIAANFFNAIVSSLPTYSNGTGGAGSGTSNQGFGGGTGQGNLGGGGGGAGEAGGTNATPNYASAKCMGGDGLSSSITGSAVARAGGGSGAASTQPTAGSTGGGGTGGSGGGNTTGTAGGNGTANTGSGGGSAGENGGNSGNGGTGGAGVVILRVPTASYSGTTAGSPNVATSGNFKIITFTGDGSYTT